MITQDEVNDQIWQRLLPADADGDQAITQEELEEYRESLPPRKFRRLDDNSDGLITEDEVHPEIWERLSESDTDGNGEITPEEFPTRDGGGVQRRFRFARLAGFALRRFF